jgi:integrase
MWPQRGPGPVPNRLAVKMGSALPKVNLTDRKVKSLKRAKAGERYELLDLVVPGLGVRVTDGGARTWILKTRYPGSPHPTRRALGDYPAMSLERAREKAGRWRILIKQGIDPGVAEERERQASVRRQATTFAVVAEDWFRDKLPGERKGKEVERDVRKAFITAWGKRPITDITDLDVVSVINAKKKDAPAQARNLLGHAKRLFAWAVDQRVYGLKASPCESLKPTKIIGEKSSSGRILSDDELFALWRAAARLPYPHGPVYRLLVLTALRLNEAADASWLEFDRQNKRWTIPAARMKGKNGKARPHVVPLTDGIVGVLAALPRFNKGPYLFSTTFGEKPVWMSDKVKKRLDQRMLRTLRALARQRKEDAFKVNLQPWTNHDIRRTVRSGLSRLKMTEEAREAVLAHVRPGIKGTYDLYDYFDEKREALELWAARVREISTPGPDNVVRLSAVTR